MEKNELNNKLDNLRYGLKHLNGIFGSAMKTIDSHLKDELDEKQFKRYEAFRKKYISLILDGKQKEAQELKEKYSEQF